MRARRALRPLLVAPLLLPVSCSPSDGGAEPGAAIVRRDSAGIEIVESASPVWPEGEGWTIGDRPLFVIRGSDGGDENRLLDPTSIDVDSRGRIIVGDGNQAGWNAVLVYDADGRFLFQAGREGEGPGEFGQLWWASVYRGDSIAAFDMVGEDVTIFEPDGQLGRTVRLPQLPVERPAQGTFGFTAGIDAAYGDGSFLAYPFGTLNIEDGAGQAWYEHELVRLSPDGASVDSLGRFRIMARHWTGTEQKDVVFAPSTVRAVGDSLLYYGEADRFELGVYDPEGRLLRLIRRAWDPTPVTDVEVGYAREWYLDLLATSPEIDDELLERLAREFDGGRFAETLPAFSAALVDDAGYLWVEEFRWLSPQDPHPANPPSRWSVFDPTGRWLGQVTTPPGYMLRYAGADRVLGFIPDEYGVREIYAFPLDRGASAPAGGS